MKVTILLLFLFPLISCSNKHKKENHQKIFVYQAAETPKIDGLNSEACWDNTAWHALNENWSNTSYDSTDFNGRYKMIWNKKALYILIEITDDVLYAPYTDPLNLWGNNDSVQLFIDEDNSGGLHHYNHNAFVYNIGLNGQVLDLDTDKKPRFFNHVTSKRNTQGTLSTWEIEVKLYEEDFKKRRNYAPRVLHENKEIGFALAYCDNDSSWQRENYIGSVFVPEDYNNQGWINADIFGTLILKNSALENERLSEYMVVAKTNLLIPFM